MAAVNGDTIDRHAELMHAFRWRVPEDFNIARSCLRWADDPARIALWCVDRGRDAPESVTYAQLRDDAHRLSAALVAMGVAPGDRVAIVMPQARETAVAYLAVLQIGAVAMPLSNSVDREETDCSAPQCL